MIDSPEKLVTRQRTKEDKSAVFYVIVLGVWVALMAGFIDCFVTALRFIPTNHVRGTVATVLLCLCAVFIALFWLNGSKDLLYPLWYHLLVRHHRPLLLPPARASSATPRVVMVYCTADDLAPATLAQCLDQDYENYEVVILDDSKTTEYKDQVDQFAAEHDLRVIRREKRVGFKAGNLNHFLQADTSWDYFVILDSDEIIPHSFISRALDYFAFYPDAGIVQGSHRATRNRNAFMRSYAIGIDSHWDTYQSMKGSSDLRVDQVSRPPAMSRQRRR